MVDGKFVEQGSSEVLNRPSHARTRQFAFTSPKETREIWTSGRAGLYRQPCQY